MPREINTAGYDLIKEFEQGPNGGFAPMPYLCPAGKLTIGWGHTGPDVKPGMIISAHDAEELLDRDLDWAEACVEKYAPGCNDNEFAAFASLCFNIGPDPGKGFPSSTAVRLHNKGDKAGAARAIGLWNKATVDGQLVTLPGLVRRRAAEAALYLTPPADAFARQTMPQAVQHETAPVANKTVITGAIGTVAAAGAVVDQVKPTLDAVNKATEAAMSAATAVGAVKAAAMSLVEGRGLAAVLTVVALGCVGFLVWRYVIKGRRGEIAS